jgi:hypothetical protein
MDAGLAPVEHTDPLFANSENPESLSPLAKPVASTGVAETIAIVREVSPVARAGREAAPVSGCAPLDECLGTACRLLLPATLLSTRGLG